MSAHYQKGYLRSVKRKTGSSCWELLWREISPTGTIVRRTAVIGTVEEYPTEELAHAAVNGLRTSINEQRNRKWHQPILIADLIDHYILTELSENASWHSHATRTVYREFLERWIRPNWGTTKVPDVRTVAVEDWLRHLQRQDGQSLASSTKAKVRNIMSVLFNHAIRYEWLEQGKNPINLVRQSTQRMKTPVVLELHEIQSLLTMLESPYRLMVLLAVTTGLRRSELFAVKWGDIDFPSLTMHIRRSIYMRAVGNCKS